MASAYSRVALLVCLLAGLLSAQRYSFKDYGQDDGLANLDVYCLMQDRAGFLWVGTENGLFRYDGHRFRVYGKRHGLPSSQIMALHQTANGEIWVGTYQGLARLRGESFEAVRAGPGSGAMALGSDDAGTLYVGTIKGLLVSPAAPVGGMREFRQISAAAGGDGAQQVFAIAVEGVGRVWYGCGAGLCRLEGDHARQLVGVGVPEDRWRGLLLDSHKTLWARSVTGLIARADGAEKFTHYDAGLPASARNPTVVMDRDGEVYVPTSQGLAHREANGWRLIRRANGLPVASVDYFLQDREGSAWIALDGGGLVRWLGYKNAETWTESEGLSHDVVWTLGRDSNGQLWAATQAGLSRFLPARNRWESWKHPSLGTDTTMPMVAGRDGSWWVGQAPGGLFHFDPRTGAAEHFGARNRVCGIPTSIPWQQTGRTGSGWARLPDCSLESAAGVGCGSSRQKRTWSGTTPFMRCWKTGEGRFGPAVRAGSPGWRTGGGASSRPPRGCCTTTSLISPKARTGPFGWRIATRLASAVCSSTATACARGTSARRTACARPRPTSCDSTGGAGCG